MADMKSVLVTGGAGFIGANLVRLLLEHGYAVTVLDNLSTGRREYLDGLRIQFIEGDILDVELVNEVVPGHNGIVHLAAQTGVPGSVADPRRDCEVNVIGTLNLLPGRHRPSVNAVRQRAPEAGLPAAARLHAVPDAGAGEPAQARRVPRVQPARGSV